MKFLTDFPCCIHSDLMEYILNCQELNTPSLYLKRYTTPVDIVLESGKTGTDVSSSNLLISEHNVATCRSTESLFPFPAHLLGSESNFRKKKNIPSFVSR